MKSNMDNDKIKKVAKQLLDSDLGLTKAQVAGLVGGFILESQLNPKAKNSINAQGIAQWLGSRRDAYSRLHGKSLLDSSLEDQVNYVIYELKGPERVALRHLKSTSSVKDAAIFADKYYERSEGTEKIRSKKWEYAEQVMKLL